jgi:hypothetical protein
MTPQSLIASTQRVGQALVVLVLKGTATARPAIAEALMIALKNMMIF